jgi:hypothetical protein
MASTVHVHCIFGDDPVNKEYYVKVVHTSVLAQPYSTKEHHKGVPVQAHTGQHGTA